MKTQVLVIGGGFAGVTISQRLEAKGIKTLLVDRKNYFEVTYAVLRDVAAPKVNDGQARQFYEQILAGEFIQDSVETLTEREAILASGNKVEFEQVVIASGSRYPSLPLAKSEQARTMEQRKAELQKYNRKLAQASNVLIIGGGVVGVELAGEIAYAMPELDVTLAHNKSVLLEGYKKKAQIKALQQLTSLGVNVEFDSGYQPQDDGVYQDKNSNKSIKPDVVFTATGTKPNNEFLLEHFSHILNPKGLVKVDANLAVVGQNKFYALGDIADVGEGKLGYLASNQAEYLAKAIIEDRAGKKVKAYKRNPFMSLVPTGQKTGIVQLPFMVTSWSALVGMKQKDLFISKTFKGFSR